MDFQFIIPTSNSELQNSNRNNYFVKQVYDAKDLNNLLRDARNAFSSSDPFYIFDHFDTFFSLIENANAVQMLTLLRGCDLIYVTLDKYGQLLTVYLQTNNSQDRNSHLNLTKMILFLSIGLIKCIDTIVDDNGSKKGAQKNRQADTASFDWEEKRFRAILQIYNFIQLPLEMLWNESIAEEEFVNMICDLCYFTLEQNSIKEKRVQDTIFQILGTAIKRYNHALTFPVRILQIIITSEISLVPIAHGINLLYEEFEIKTIFSVLLNELIETLNSNTADTQTSRFASHFLSELGHVAPKLIVPHLSTLGEELLNLDSYVIRNSVLELMGDVICVELSSEDLSDELKETRDTFLTDLLNHIMDASAFVRSKVLQVWNHMKMENCVPLVWQNRVLQMAADRLDDKGTMVRKHAIHLIKAFLETNPFAAKLSLQELKDSLDKEMDKLQAIRGKMIDVEKKTVELEEKWNSMITELMPVIEEMLAQSAQDSMEPYVLGENHVEQMETLLLEKNYKKAVALLKQADLTAGNREARLLLPFDQQCAYYAQLLKSYLFINQKDYSEEYSTQDQTLKFLNDSIEFAEIIAQAVPKIENMLMSKINTDVFEAVDFFTTAYLFGIKGTENGMRKMLFLVWCGDKEKRDAVIKAYHRVLFGTDQTGRSHAIKVVENLTKFFTDITTGHFAATEVLMSEWIQNNDIDAQIIQVMFEKFTQKFPDTSNNESRMALQFLIMASSQKHSVATANIEVFSSILFSDRSLNDPRIFASCLQVLKNLAPNKESTKYYKRYDSTHSLIANTLEIFSKMFFYPKLDNFDEIAMQTFDFIYCLCQAPDTLCQHFILTLCTKLKEISNKCNNNDNNENNGDDSNNEQNYLLSLPQYIWARIIFVFGYLALKEMIFLDIDIYKNIKYRQELMEEKKNQNKKNMKRKSNISNVSNMNMSASSALKRLSGSAAEPQEADEMLVGATAEDTIAELINLICESELLYSPTSILPKIIPIIMEILKYPAKYPHTSLQQAACLTLIRFMCVSSKFCEDNMQFLMGILNASKNIKMKCNIIIGLSDLTFRFPNVIEPWTSHLYSTLHETNDELRLTAVKMLSHLILHEMIRVKGQISDLALCIVDPNDQIKDITQQFFKEIAHKSNILYNVLPDIISRLSSVNMQLEEEKYRIIMKYVIGLIQKDRQVESLVEKLCLRFNVTHDERQWRDIAYCLSLLNYTEKTIKKLIDNMQMFKDKVQVDEVYDCFKLIISNTSKLAKPELKTIIQDFETKLQECFAINENGNATNPNNDDNGSSNAQKERRSGTDMPPPKFLPKRGKKVPIRKKPVQQTRNNSDSSDSDDDDFERRSPRKQIGSKNSNGDSGRGSSISTGARSSARNNSRRNVVIEDSSSSSSDEDLDNRPRRNKRKA